MVSCHFKLFWWRVILTSFSIQLAFMWKIFSHTPQYVHHLADHPFRSRILPRLLYIDWGVFPTVGNTHSSNLPSQSWGRNVSFVSASSILCDYFRSFLLSWRPLECWLPCGPGALIWDWVGQGRSAEGWKIPPYYMVWLSVLWCRKGVTNLYI
jgi:hypothetical protein